MISENNKNYKPHVLILNLTDKKCLRKEVKELLLY